MSNFSVSLDSPKDVFNGSPSSPQECITKQTTSSKVLKIFAYSLILLISLIGNLFVIIVFAKNKRLRKTINYFVLNMAISDLLPPLTVMPIWLVQIATGSSAWYLDSPVLLGVILCKLTYFLADVSLLVSIESLVLMSTDRLIAVVFPLHAKRISTMLRLKLILCAWIIAIAVHAPYFYTFRLFPDGNYTYCELDWGPAFDHVQTNERYFTTTFIIFFLMPLCLLTVMYSVMAVTLKRKTGFGIHEGGRKEKNRQVMLLSVCIVGGFALCIIPNVVFIFIRIFVWNWQKPTICSFLTVIPFLATFMMHSWSAVNPSICFVLINSYRSSLRELVSLRSRGRSLHSHTTSVHPRSQSSAC